MEVICASREVRCRPPSNGHFSWPKPNSKLVQLKRQFDRSSPVDPNRPRISLLPSQKCSSKSTLLRMSGLYVDREIRYIREWPAPFHQSCGVLTKSILLFFVYRLSHTLVWKSRYAPMDSVIRSLYSNIIVAVSGKNAYKVSSHAKMY